MDLTPIRPTKGRAPGCPQLPPNFVSSQESHVRGPEPSTSSVSQLPSQPVSWPDMMPFTLQHRLPLASQRPPRPVQQPIQATVQPPIQAIVQPLIQAMVPPIRSVQQSIQTGSSMARPPRQIQLRPSISQQQRATRPPSGDPSSRMKNPMPGVEQITTGVKHLATDQPVNVFDEPVSIHVNKLTNVGKRPLSIESKDKDYIKKMKPTENVNLLSVSNTHRNITGNTDKTIMMESVNDHTPINAVDDEIYNEFICIESDSDSDLDNNSPNEHKNLIKEMYLSYVKLFSQNNLTSEELESRFFQMYTTHMTEMCGAGKLRYKCLTLTRKENMWKNKFEDALLKLKILAAHIDLHARRLNDNSITPHNIITRTIGMQAISDTKKNGLPAVPITHVNNGILAIDLTQSDDENISQNNLNMEKLTNKTIQNGSHIGPSSQKNDLPAVPITHVNNGISAVDLTQSDDVNISQNNLNMEKSMNKTIQNGYIGPFSQIHPAPLPVVPNQSSNHFRKNIPPAPIITLSLSSSSQIPQALEILWDMTINNAMAEIRSYQIYFYREISSVAPRTDMWRKICEVNALPLPMACSLTMKLVVGEKYYFAVRAVDEIGRVGEFSLPNSIHYQL